METMALTKIKFMYIIQVLLNIHLINGGVVFSTSGKKYIGESFTITYTITPTYTSAIISQNGTTRSQCIPGCIPSSQNSVSFTTIGTGITVEFNPVLSTHLGDWQCDNSDGNFTVYTFTPETRPSVATTEASTEGTSSSGGLSGGTIAGIVIGVVAGLSCVLVFLVYKFKLAQPHVRSLLPDERSKQEAKIGSQVELLNKLCKLKQHIHSVKWIYDNEPVVVGEKYKGGTTNCPSLTIRCVSQEDFGLWKCILETKNSEQTFFVQLISKDSGYPTLGNLPPFEN